MLRPAVRGQTNRYNAKLRMGRGFTLKELSAAGIVGVHYARSIGIAIDLRRKDTSNETLKANSTRIKDYLSRMILFPRHPKKPELKPQVKEATEEQMKGPDARIQNIGAQVIRMINI